MTREFYVLVTGADGQLGRALMRSRWPSGLRMTAMTHRELDIVSTQQVDTTLATHRFDAVINAAAYTSVDRAEREFADAFATNTEAAANLAATCARHGAVVIHLSTDYVFDGIKTAPYVESDPINPLSAYGKTKAAGELEVHLRAPRHIILRTAWLYSAERNNFVSKILDLASERDELFIVADQTGNPTSAADLAAAIIAILDHLFLKRGACHARAPWGVYHCVNSGVATWHDLAKATVEIANGRLARQPVVRPITTADYPTPATRPANSQLNCGKLETVFGIRLRPWREALAPVVDEILKRYAHERNYPRGREGNASLPPHI